MTHQKETQAKKKILILAANPETTSRLRLDEEVREIEEGLRRSKYRDQFEIHSKMAIRLRDFRRALLDHEPQIVHFTGHGKQEGLFVEDEIGLSTLFSTKALADLFKLCSQHVECVILNACYTARQARAINKHIDYVVGMRKEIKDKSSLEFAVGFYDALGAGRSVEDAFEFGRNAVLTEYPGLSEHLIPVLKIRKKTSVIKNDKTQQFENSFNEERKATSEIGVETAKTYELLFGRERDIAKVISLLDEKDKPKIINIHGLGGVGKTSLVREIVEIYRPGRVVWITAKRLYFEGSELYRNPLTESITLQQVYRKIASGFGGTNLDDLMAIKEKKERIEWLQNLLRENKCLVIVDNFETIDEDFKQFLTEISLLFSGGHSRLIITSRFDLQTYSFIYNYKLKGLREHDAMALLLHELGKNNEGADILLEKKKLKNVYRVTRGMPLALKLIAAKIRSSHIGALDHIMDRLQNIEFTNEREVYEKFYKFIYLDVWNSLSENARDLSISMCLLDVGEDIPISYLYRITVEREEESISQEVFQGAFEEIKKYSLVDYRGGKPPLFSLHPLTQSFIKAEMLAMDDQDVLKKL